MQRTRVLENPVNRDELKARLAGFAAEHGAASPTARKAAMEALKAALADGRAFVRDQL